MKKIFSFLIVIALLCNITLGVSANEVRDVDFDVKQFSCGEDKGIYASYGPYKEEVVIDNVVYGRNIYVQNGIEYRATYYKVVKLFDTPEVARTATEVNIVDKIGDLPVLGIDLYNKYSSWEIEGYAQNVTKISIPNTLKVIGTCSFKGFENVEELKTPADLIAIGEAAFHGMKRVKKLIVPIGVAQINDSTFYGCESLETVEIKDSKVSRIGEWAFLGCTSLKEIALPKSLRTIEESAFSKCTSLKSVNIPSGLECIWGSVFVGCTSLQKVTLPQSCKVIDGSIFSRCNSLTNITFKAKRLSIRDGGLSLSKSKKLKSIRIYAKKLTLDKNAKGRVQFFSSTAAKNCKIYVTSKKIKKQIQKTIKKKNKNRYRIYVMKNK